MKIKLNRQDIADIIDAHCRAKGLRVIEQAYEFRIGVCPNGNEVSIKTEFEAVTLTVDSNCAQCLNGRTKDGAEICDNCRRDNKQGPR